MVGHKLGEFSPTRKFSGHTPADKKAAAEGTSAPTASGSAPKAAQREVQQKQLLMLHQHQNPLLPKRILNDRKK